MKLLLLLSFLCLGFSATTQSLCNQNTSFKILHFTKTTGYDHGTRAKSKDMFTSIGSERNFTVTDSELSSVFNDSLALFEYAVIIFSNTSGNTLFNSAQKENMEAYINNGGSFIGIHAATDTYRTGWDFYNTLVGGIVQTNPNHTSNNYNGTMDHQSQHEILNGIPDPWDKTEEYYYWEKNGGRVDTGEIGTLLTVRNTGSNSYDAERAITWMRTFPSGTRSFYTALGHANSNYDSDTNFKKLLTNAVCWAAYDKNFAPSSAPKIEVSNANIRIDKGKGIIIKSPNGACFMIIVGNDGQLKSIPVACE